MCGEGREEGGRKRERERERERQRVPERLISVPAAKD
jgi:hypothetical protein